MPQMSPLSWVFILFAFLFLFLANFNNFKNYTQLSKTENFVKTKEKMSKW